MELTKESFIKQLRTICELGFYTYHPESGERTVYYNLVGSGSQPLLLARARFLKQMLPFRWVRECEGLPGTLGVYANSPHLTERSVHYHKVLREMRRMKKDYPAPDELALIKAESDAVDVAWVRWIRDRFIDILKEIASDTDVDEALDNMDDRQLRKLFRRAFRRTPAAEYSRVLDGIYVDVPEIANNVNLQTLEGVQYDRDQSA